MKFLGCNNSSNKYIVTGGGAAHALQEEMTVAIDRARRVRQRACVYVYISSGCDCLEAYTFGPSIILTVEEEGLFSFCRF